MGLPIASTIEKFKLRNLENKFLEINKNKIFWVCYIDDIFAIIHKKKKKKKITIQF